MTPDIEVKWLRDQLSRVHRLLDQANVPEIVNAHDVPENAAWCRLKWFIDRRKDVKESEKVGCTSWDSLILQINRTSVHPYDCNCDYCHHPPRLRPIRGCGEPLSRP